MQSINQKFVDVTVESCSTNLLYVNTVYYVDGFLVKWWKRVGTCVDELQLHLLQLLENCHWWLISAEQTLTYLLDSIVPKCGFFFHSFFLIPSNEFIIFLTSWEDDFIKWVNECIHMSKENYWQSKRFCSFESTFVCWNFWAFDQWFCKNYIFLLLLSKFINANLNQVYCYKFWW